MWGSSKFLRLRRHVAWFVVIFYTETGGNRFLRNISNYLPDCTLSHPRRQLFSQSSDWETLNLRSKFGYFLHAFSLTVLSSFVFFSFLTSAFFYLYFFPSYLIFHYSVCHFSFSSVHLQFPFILIVACSTVLFFLPLFRPFRSRDSAVDIATGYLLDDREVGVLVPVGSRIFTSPCHPDRLWGPDSFPGIKRQGREADHSPPTSVQVKKMWIYTSTHPYAFMA
jgi:hypothetical protein